MQKIKCGDKVVVLAGKDKGRQGDVAKIIKKIVKSKKGKSLLKHRLVVKGINLVKKHVKPNPNEQKPGGIIEKEAPIDISNVAIFNPTTKKPDRVGFKVLEDGGKVRCFKSNGEVIDV